MSHLKIHKFQNITKVCHNNMWVIRYWNTDRPTVGKSSASLSLKGTTISSSNCVSKIQPNILRNFIPTIELAFWGLYHPWKLTKNLAHTHLHIDGAKWFNYLPWDGRQPQHIGTVLVGGWKSVGLDTQMHKNDRPKQTGSQMFWFQCTISQSLWPI